MRTINSSEESSIKRLLTNLKKEQSIVIAATTCSILNKIFDLAPPVLIGLSVDVVTRKESSWIAGLGFINVPNQIALIASLSFLIWTAESCFEYFYGTIFMKFTMIHNIIK